MNFDTRAFSVVIEELAKNSYNYCIEYKYNSYIYTLHMVVFGYSVAVLLVQNVH